MWVLMLRVRERRELTLTARGLGPNLYPGGREPTILSDPFSKQTSTTSTSSNIYYRLGIGISRRPKQDRSKFSTTRTSSNHSPTHVSRRFHVRSHSCTGVGSFAEIIIVRHGETSWNALHKFQGHLDVELNDVGRQQAVAVGDRLSKEPKISAVYSSDLKRALETAKIIADSCGGLEVIRDPDLRERNLGDLQGLVYHEFATANPTAYQAFVSPQTDREIPGGGESSDQIYKRCTAALQRIGRKHQGERVAVVTHGGSIRALHKRACQNGQSTGKVLNSSISVFHLSNGDQWEIKTWCDVSHLNPTGFLTSGFGGDATSG